MKTQRAGHNKRVLLVEDDRAMCQSVADALGKRGFDIVCGLSADDALEAAQQRDFDVVLTDLELGAGNGFAICERLRSLRSDVCVVVMTAFGTLENAVSAIRAGAYDFLTKPFSMDALAQALERAAHHRRLRAELERLYQKAERRIFSSIVGSSPAMRRTNAMIARVASGDASVLITGESGTGKELIAKALHEQSGRKGPLLALNCAAMPEALLESELFGHVRGAFTDAHADRKGLFREANHGTVFLDEIGELPLAMQAKLLRALQERRVRPVGGSREYAFETRVIAATTHNIEADVAKKRFRQDLYYRINVIHMEVWPLRARGNDILELAQYFLMRCAVRSGGPLTRLGTEAAERLISYEWPGNVRELENCMEHANALAVYDEISVNDLPAKLRQEPAPAAGIADDPGDLPRLRAVEYRYIRKVLQAVKGNKTLAARVMGFDRRTLYRKLAAFSQPGRLTEDEL